MQVKVLEKLICPACGHFPFEIHGFCYYSSEIIKDGVLVCKNCGLWFPIIDRLLELVVQNLADLSAWQNFYDQYSKYFISLHLAPTNPGAHETSHYKEQLDQRKHFDSWVSNKSRNYFHYESTPFWNAVDTIVFGPWRSNIRTGSWLLDVGCAQGRSTFKLIDLDIQVVGFDISKEMIRQIIKRADAANYNHRSSFFVADASKFPFQQMIFDYVLIYGVLHHLPNPQDALKEVDRVLKPGGRYLGCENNKTIFRNLFDLLMKIFPIWQEDAGSEPVISEKMIEDWAKGTSLDVHMNTNVFVPPHLINLFNNKVAIKVLKATNLLGNNVPYFRHHGGLIFIEGRK
jgi:ubiquinone/menaquinone biosynthesis C-methylase UbiE/uncharacterized protein YbaR (Trm112 family)